MSGTQQGEEQMITTAVFVYTGWKVKLLLFSES